MAGKRMMKYGRKALRKVKNLFACACPPHCSSAVDIECPPKNSNVHQPESEAGVSIVGPRNTLASSRPHHTLRYLMQLEDAQDASHIKPRRTLRYLMQLEDAEDAASLRPRQTLGYLMQLEDAEKNASPHTFSDLPLGEFDSVKSELPEGNEDNRNILVAADTDNTLQVSPVISINVEVEEGVGMDSVSEVINHAQSPLHQLAELVTVPTLGEDERHDAALALLSPNSVMRMLMLLILLLIVRIMFG